MSGLNDEVPPVDRRDSFGGLEYRSTDTDNISGPDLSPERFDHRLRSNLGTFARFQAEYAAYGIPTFPVTIADGDKRPAIRNYLNLGLLGSKKLADRFLTHDALGFGVRRAGLFVLDVDTDDQRVLDEAQRRHGTTPIITRTGSGHFHAWYRHNGEGRWIRPDRDLPIDYLGDGYVVAPPSKGTKGDYSFLKGSLRDLASLPTAIGVEPPMGGPGAARGAVEFAGAVKRGERNSRLLKHCLQHAPHCDGFDAMLDVARTFSAGFEAPLGDSEIARTAQSAWTMQINRRNWCGAGGRVVFTRDEIGSLPPDALSLLGRLRSHHWGRHFAVANAMAATMPGGSWSRNRLRAARRILVASGMIVEIKAPSKLGGAAQYVWPRVVDSDHQ